MRLPAKYKRHGLHIWCNTCKKVVTKKPCGLTHNMVFQSRIWNPHTSQTDIIKSWTRDFDESKQRHEQFKKELKDNDYNLRRGPVQFIPKLFSQAFGWYMDYLQDLNVESYEVKNLTEDYVKAQRRYISQFVTAIKAKGYNPNAMDLRIGKNVVGIFHNYLEDQGYAAKTYNHHIVAMRTMYNVFLKEKFVSENPFLKVRQKYTTNNPDIVHEEELEKLFKVITYENGWAQIGNTKLNRYRHWLKDAILLALYTGERRDGVFLLQWKHVEENYLKIPNFKVNQKQKIEDYHFVPITNDIAEFLLNLERGSEKDYLIEPFHKNRRTLKDQCSKAFTHFWLLAGLDKRKSFKTLRKTLETRLWTMLGDKSKALKRHKNLSTTIDYYLGQKEIMKELKGQKMFNFSPKT